MENWLTADEQGAIFFETLSMALVSVDIYHKGGKRLKELVSKYLEGTEGGDPLTLMLTDVFKRVLQYLEEEEERRTT